MGWFHFNWGMVPSQSGCGREVRSQPDMLIAYAYAISIAHIVFAAPVHSPIRDAIWNIAQNL